MKKNNPTIVPYLYVLVLFVIVAIVAELFSILSTGTSLTFIGYDESSNSLIVGNSGDVPLEDFAVFVDNNPAEISHGVIGPGAEGELLLSSPLDAGYHDVRIISSGGQVRIRINVQTVWQIDLSTSGLIG